MLVQRHKELVCASAHEHEDACIHVHICKRVHTYLYVCGDASMYSYMHACSNPFTHASLIDCVAFACSPGYSYVLQ